MLVCSFSLGSVPFQVWYDSKTFAPWEGARTVKIPVGLDTVSEFQTVVLPAGLYQSARTAITRHHRLVGLNNRNFFSLTSRI